MQCECCKTDNLDILRRVPPIMDHNAPPLNAPPSENDRHICSDCLGVWYDQGVTSPAKIGAITLKQRADAQSS